MSKSSSIISISRGLSNTLNYYHVKARILWPALGFPEVIGPETSQNATSFIHLLILTDRNPADQKQRLKNIDVARHLRYVPWKDRHRRYLYPNPGNSFPPDPGKCSFPVNAIAEIKEVRLSQKDSNSLVNKIEFAQKSLIGGLSKFVLDFYANSPINLKYLYEITIKVTFNKSSGSKPKIDLYNLFWNDRQHYKKPEDISAEMFILKHYFALKREPGNYILHNYEYDCDDKNKEIPEHRVEVLHPLFVWDNIKTKIKIGHISDTHICSRVDKFEENLIRVGGIIAIYNSKSDAEADAMMKAFRAIFEPNDPVWKKHNKWERWLRNPTKAVSVRKYRDGIIAHYLSENDAKAEAFELPWRSSNPISSLSKWECWIIKPSKARKVILYKKSIIGIYDKWGDAEVDAKKTTANTPFEIPDVYHWRLILNNSSNAIAVRKVGDGIVATYNSKTDADAEKIHGTYSWSTEWECWIRKFTLAKDVKLYNAASHYNNWNKSTLECYKNAKEDCDVLLLTGDLIDYGRGHIMGNAPLKKISSYKYDLNWMLFYTILAARDGGYKKPTFTVLGNHDWRINPYPPENRFFHFYWRANLTTQRQTKIIHGPGADYWSYTYDLFAALDTDLNSVKWYLLLINPFLDYTIRCPGGYIFLMLDWAKKERNWEKYDMTVRAGSPNADYSLNKVQKNMVQWFVDQKDKAKVMGLHAALIGPRGDWPDDVLDRGFIVCPLCDGTGYRKDYSGSPLDRFGPDCDCKNMQQYPNRLTIRPILACNKKQKSLVVYNTDTLKINPIHGTIMRYRDWLIHKLCDKKVPLVLSGHVHRNSIFAIPKQGNRLYEKRLTEWAVKRIMQTPIHYPKWNREKYYAFYDNCPLFVNTTSAGQIGSKRPTNKGTKKIPPGYAEIELTQNGKVEFIDFLERDILILG